MPGPETVIDALKRARTFLESHGVLNARLNVEWLLASVLDLDRVQLYIQYDRPLAEAERAAFAVLLERRARREPLQYLLGRWQFRGLELQVDRRALIPRPETELTAQLAVDAARRFAAPRVADIGTGSGCIALSVAAEVPGARVWATDVSPDALALARANASLLGLAVTFLAGDLYEALPDEMRGGFDVIVSNPPYVAEDEYALLQPEIGYEPRGALLAAGAGTEFLSRLAAGAAHWLSANGSLILEGSPTTLPAIARDWGGEVVNDLSGLPRCLIRGRHDSSGVV
ncbi:MAG: peptide chain release factor N(5)-glutamine methyltransferase [Candidatus Geothermincolia bacterium]